MNKLLSIALVVICLALLCLPVMAFAQTEEEFVLTCSTKTSAETEAFCVENAEAEKVAGYSSIGKIPADTYVRCTGMQDKEAGYVECFVYENGELQKIWVKNDALVPAWTLLYFQDGAYVKLHERIANDPQALSEYCNTYFPGRKFSTDEKAPDFVSDAVVSAEWTQKQFGEGSLALSVRLITLGLRDSVVATQDGEMTVPTEYVSFGGADGIKHRVGVVLAPRTGEASLRKEASGSAELIWTCKTGRIVVVLEEGSTFTKIRYDDKVGYIRTDCLVFPDCDDEAAVGVIHIKGNKDGEDYVTVRSTASTSTAKVREMETGTSVLVHGEKGKWYMVEHEGWFGYVQQQYLTLEQE